MDRAFHARRLRRLGTLLCLLTVPDGAAAQNPRDAEPFRIPPTNAIRWVPNATLDIAYAKGLATAQPISALDPFVRPRRQADQRLHAAAGLAAIVPLEREGQLILGIGLDEQIYRRFKELNETRALAGGQLRWQAGERTTMTIGADLTQSWATRDEIPYYRSSHAGVSVLHGFDAEFGVRGGVDATFINYDSSRQSTENLDNADGVLSAFTVAPRYTPAGMPVELEIALQAGGRSADAEFFAFDFRSVAPTIRYALATGDILDLGASYTLRRFHEIDPIDGVLREDRVRGVSAQWLHPLFGQVYLFARAGGFEQTSTVRRQSYDSRECTFGTTARF